MTNATIPAHVDGETICFAAGPCSLGLILAAISKDGLCAVLFGDESNELVRDLRDRFPHANLIEGGHEAGQALAQIVGFIEKPTLGLDLPLDPRGTPFQQRVWKALRDVPVGATVSYGEIAKRIGQPRGAKDVAEACAANAIAVAIPCHRIVKADGSISGYRWGVKRKRALLSREAA
jgi:AraC family transcriptional regulator, regulatory protein of adaptative response / methylated-DNA-[protein]-cysteine methyltransferase